MNILALVELSLFPGMEVVSSAGALPARTYSVVKSALPSSTGSACGVSCVCRVRQLSDRVLYYRDICSG